jgi:glucosamine--fructose-6-phosphate aminotransferase (isomerizing)
VSKGATFVSDTDTEVVPHLLAYLHTQAAAAGKPLSLPKLVLTAMVHLEGAFALLVQAPAAHPGQLVAAKRGSPLVYAVSGGAHPTPLEEDDQEEASGDKAGDKATGSTPPEPVQVWLASDAAALLSHSRHITVLQDEDLLHLGADGGVATYNLGAVLTKAGSVPQALSDLAALGPCVSGLSVERKARRLSMPLESVMKVGALQGGREGR